MDFKLKELKRLNEANGYRGSGVRFDYWACPAKGSAF